MRNFKYIFLLYATISMGCSSNKPVDTSSDSTLAEQAKTSFRAALKYEREAMYWESIKSYDDAIGHYKMMDSTQENYYLYLAYRFRANMLNIVRLHDQAAKSIDQSLIYLPQVKSWPANKTKELEEISSLAYKADYQRADGDYRESNDILLNLIERSEVVKDPKINAQLLNQIGQNYISLGNQEEALIRFNQSLKNQSVDPIKKAYYLNNRSFVAFNLGQKQMAYEDISEAIGIASALEDTIAQVRFRTYKGEYYLQDGDYLKSDDNLAQAMLMATGIEDYPDLFKVYRLRSTVSAVLGNQEASNTYNSRYEELLQKNYETIKQYSASEEMAILTANMQKIELDRNREGIIERLRLQELMIYSISIIAFILLILQIRKFYVSRKLKLAAAEIMDKYKD